MGSKETQIIKDLSEQLHEAVKSLERQSNSFVEEELRRENEALKKELQEYKIFVRCSELDNFNPAHFQKGYDDEIDSCIE